MTIITVVVMVIVFLGTIAVLKWIDTGRVWKQKPKSKSVGSDEPSEDDLVAAIIDGIENDEWEDDTYGYSPVMKNKLTDAKIYLDTSIAGMFCNDTYKFIDRKNGLKIIEAYKNHTKKNGWLVVESITGHTYEPPSDDVDPALVKEARKNLKHWTAKK